MIRLSDEDKLKLKYDMNVRVKHVDLSIGSFYAKYCFDEEIFRELLGKKFLIWWELSVLIII